MFAFYEEKVSMDFQIFLVEIGKKSELKIYENINQLNDLHWLTAEVHRRRT